MNQRRSFQVLISAKCICVLRRKGLVLDSTVGVLILFILMYSRDKCIKMFTVVLFKNEKNWKQSKCPKLEKQLKNGIGGKC